MENLCRTNHTIYIVLYVAMIVAATRTEDMMKGTGIYRDGKALERWLADQGGPAAKCARCARSCKQPKKVVVVSCERYEKERELT